MRKKKISELDLKDNPAPTDLIPIVDMSLTRRKTKKTTLADLVELVDAVPNTDRGVPGGVATLNETTGRLEPDQVPALAVTETFNVSSAVAMLALPAQTGDFAIRSDINKTFVLAGPTPAVLENWQEIIVPTPSLTALPDVNVEELPSVRSALVFDPVTQLWRSADIAKITDGGAF
jgi:hypothetical protein